MQRRVSRQRTRASGGGRATMSQVPTGPAASAAAKPVNVIGFPGGFNWPIWVAQERGLFSSRGIAVDVVATAGSVFQWTRLAMGSSNLRITFVDKASRH